MKKSKIIIFSTALVLLLFANISVTLFDGTENEININLNKTEVFAHGGNGEGSAGGDGSAWQRRYNGVLKNCFLGRQSVCSGDIIVVPQ